LGANGVYDNGKHIVISGDMKVYLSHLDDAAILKFNLFVNFDPSSTVLL
jgi:hypothetical protein